MSSTEDCEAVWKLRLGDGSSTAWHLETVDRKLGSAGLVDTCPLSHSNDYPLSDIMQ